MTDYTGKVGALHHIENEWPMYSFTAPAYNFWNGVANELERRGMSQKAIKEFLQSKDTRWMMDHYGERLEQLGAELVNKYLKELV